MSGGMRCKAQTAAILGVSRGFVTQQRARQASPKFKCVMGERLCRLGTAGYFVSWKKTSADYGEPGNRSISFASGNGAKRRSIYTSPGKSSFVIFAQ